MIRFSFLLRLSTLHSQIIFSHSCYRLLVISYKHGYDDQYLLLVMCIDNFIPFELHWFNWIVHSLERLYTLHVINLAQRVPFILLALAYDVCIVEIWQVCHNLKVMQGILPDWRYKICFLMI